MPQELDPSVQQSHQQLVQAVVADVTEQHSGEDLDTVLSALSRGLADAGVPPQPEKWLTDTASEIAEGRHVVVDRHLANSNGGPDEQVPAEAGRITGEEREAPEGHHPGQHLKDLFKGRS
jgi:hypothetical protein